MIPLVRGFGTGYVLVGLIPFSFPIALCLGYHFPNVASPALSLAGYDTLEGEGWQKLCGWCNGIIVLTGLLLWAVWSLNKYPSVLLLMIAYGLAFWCVTCKVVLGACREVSPPVYDEEDGNGDTHGSEEGGGGGKGSAAVPTVPAIVIGTQKAETQPQPTHE